MVDQKSNENNLIQEIDQIRKNIDTDKLDMSFNEIRDMCKTGELIINPDFQRTFRWKLDKCSRFLESLLLGMPIPPIFFIELSEGKYELIDGLQRICSYLAFVGDFNKSENIHKILSSKNNYKLVGCELVENLNGKRYNDLDSKLQFRLNRANIRINVLRERTKQELQYSMFNRLNTGGEKLSEQEIRNCSIRVLGNKFVDFIIRLSNYEHFQNCMKKAPKDIKEKMGMEELILRVFALKNNIEDFKSDLAPFLTRYMKGVTENNLPFNYEIEEESFKKVFRIFDKVLGEQIFITNKKRFAKYYFESFSLAMFDFVDSIDENNNDDLNKVKFVLNKAKADKDFGKLIGKEYQHKREPSEERKKIINNLLTKEFK